MSCDPPAKFAPKVSAVEQSFFVFPSLPFLEIRATRNSVCAYAAHFHQSLSLGIILAGSTRFNCAGQEYLAQPLDLVLIEPGAVHCCNPVNGLPRSYYMLHLEAGWCLAHLGLPPARECLLAVTGRLLRQPGLAVKLINSLRALRAGGPGADNRLQELLRRVVGEYCRPTQRAGRGGGCPPFELAGLENHPESVLKISDLARLHGMCRESFIRRFKRENGLTPGAYRHCLRLEEACRLLRQGHEIAEVALAAGYSDQSHFHRMFVKYYSATPGQYYSGSLSSKK